MSQSKFEDRELPISSLLLDPNNYRFQDGEDFVFADERRFVEASIQERTLRRLKTDEGIIFLKNSILTNGFIPIEKIVVRPYPYADDHYLVLEGNRRLAAIKWIVSDHEAGVNIPQNVINLLKGVPVVIVENTQDPAFYEALMGVRHVSGIKEWGGYQRAKLVVTLRDTYALSTTEVADRIGMTAHEVNRRYRAFKALQNMEQDENFGVHATSDKYTLFHEAITLPPVREWLDWDESTAHFKNNEQLDIFYSLITPSETEDGRTKPAKINSREALRELKDIIPNLEARRILFDPNSTLFDAATTAKRDKLSRSWPTQVAEAITAMERISFLDVQQFSKDDLAQVEKLRSTANNLLETYKKLSA